MDGLLPHLCKLAKCCMDGCLSCIGRDLARESHNAQDAHMRMRLSIIWCDVGMKNSPQRHCRHFEIKAYGWASGIPTFFMTQFVRYVKHALTKDGVVPSWDHRMMEIFNTQNSIGPTMLVQGFIATAWVRLLMDMGVAHPQRQMALLVRTLWDEVVMSIWKTRNHLLHNNPNFTTNLTHTQLGDRLLWYLQHKDQLSREDQFLGQYSATSIELMSTEIRQEWVQHLDIAPDTWAKEQQQIAKGQTVLTQYFQRISRAM